MYIFKVLSVIVGYYLFQVNCLDVTVYYESLCPDSQRFIVTQLYPAYEIIGDYFDIEFIPFGHAEMTNVTGSWEFECQHGDGECYGNEIQACALFLDDDVHHKRAIKFVYCAMASDDASDDDILRECAQDAEISWDAIKGCYDIGLGENLHVQYGLKTQALRPPLSYIPTVVFNGVYETLLQDEGENNFFQTVCNLLDNNPSECANI